jgi:hypothetical protein
VGELHRSLGVETVEQIGRDPFRLRDVIVGSRIVGAVDVTEQFLDVGESFPEHVPFDPATHEIGRDRFGLADPPTRRSLDRAFLRCGEVIVESADVVSEFAVVGRHG